MATVKIRSGFGQLLREALKEKDVTLRELGRRLAEQDSDALPETKRRLLHRYIDGTVNPPPEARREIAVALGIPDTTFAEDAEEIAELEALRSALQPLVPALADVLHELVVKARNGHNGGSGT